MKTVKNQLRYRFYRVIIPTLILIFTYAITLYPNSTKSYYMAHAIQRQETYASYINQTAQFYILCFVLGCIWLYQFYMMFQDVHRNSSRILLLPRSRHVVWIVDAGIFLVSSLLVLVLYFVMYAYGFELYQEAILEHSTFAYWQSSHVLTSLHETSAFLYLYPSTIVHWIFQPILLILLSLSLPFVYTIANVEKKSKYEQVIVISILIGASVLLMLLPSVWLKIGIAVLLIVWMLKTMKDCWISGRIGG